jgi:hypothetical protein
MASKIMKSSFSDARSSYTRNLERDCAEQRATRPNAGSVAGVPGTEAGLRAES